MNAMKYRSFVMFGLGVWCASTLDAAGVPARTKFLEAREAIPGEYIVVLVDEAKTAVEPECARLLGRHRGEKRRTFRSALRGFSVRMSAAEARALSEDPAVRFVEPNARVRISTVQTGATWGLDRVDQRDLPLSGTYDDANLTGAGINVYVLDTGIRTSHADFGGRASVGVDLIGDGMNGQDGHGHGTHVAGTIGGATWGVAKQVSLVAVRVLDSAGNGSIESVVGGIDWVTANHAGIAVANMSLGGGASEAIDEAVRNSVAAGVVYVVAAGNEYGSDASSRSPARVAEAITVGATTASDGRAGFSNIGRGVDLFGPGESVTSAWHTGDAATATISGTSMATPHVCGLAARLLQGRPTLTPAEVETGLVAVASSGRISGLGTGTANLLCYSGQPSGSRSAHAVNLRSYYGMWLCAEGGGGQPIVANRNDAGSWETFVLADLNGGAVEDGDPVTLRSDQGYYLSAKGGQTLTATSDVEETWAVFRIRKLEGAGPIGSSSLVGLQGADGRYWCAEGGSTNHIVVNREGPGPWETFLIALDGQGVPQPLAVGLRNAAGKWVCAEGGGGQPLYANRDGQGSWETLKLIDSNGGQLLSGDLVLFRSDNDSFVCAEGGGGQVVNATRSVGGAWESFRIHRVAGAGAVQTGDEVVIVSDGGNYWRADGSNGGQVLATGTGAGTWERFTINF